MELLCKRHFWVIRLALTFAAAWLVTRTVNELVESALVPLPTPRGAPRVTVKTEPQAALAPDKLAKATGLPVPTTQPTVTELTTPAVDLSVGPAHSSLRVRLLGTLVNEGNSEWSVCSVQDAVTLKTNTYMTHDRIQGAEVLEIARSRVIVLNNNHRESIDGTPGGVMGPRSGQPGNDAPPQSLALGASIKQVSDNGYEIPRADIEKTLANLNDLATQARFVPAFKDGQSQGFKLFSIRRDSIYTRIGIQDGDVIKRINGFELNSPEKVLEIYSKLKESSRIDIEVDRNGVSVRKTYNVR